jgi:NMD protein affecting ribosome stability and mRNA decay
MGCTDEEFDNAHRCTNCGVTGGGVENEMCEECFISKAKGL